MIPRAIPALKRLAQEHDCAVLQLRDPAEDRLQRRRLRPGRRGRDRPPFRHPRPAPRPRPARVEDQLKKAGVDYLLIQTDQPYVSRVRQFFKLRNLLGRGAR